MKEAEKHLNDIKSKNKAVVDAHKEAVAHKM
jgi:hypothetical protein